MKHKKFIRHLNDHNCFFHHHGANHDIYKNNSNQRKTTVPRHTDIDKFLCKEICKQLEIDFPKSF
ncbi:MAG: type II toxin-antitoxin system HicA family toxin [Chitinophagales bacterium]|nr:type II toxin-antitoxin system HicA family toxin [Chitinophagales bacterium]